MEEVLDKLPNKKLQIFVLWTPLLANDSQLAAQRAAALMPDSRVHHYWDLWSYANKHYAKEFDVPVSEAWDLLAVYKPYLSWSGSLPEPTFWMQRRGLKVGTPFDKDQLEAELRKLVN